MNVMSENSIYDDLDDRIFLVARASLSHNLLFFLNTNFIENIYLSSDYSNQVTYACRLHESKIRYDCFSKRADDPYIVPNCQNTIRTVFCSLHPPLLLFCKVDECAFCFLNINFFCSLCGLCSSIAYIFLFEITSGQTHQPAENGLDVCRWL